VRESPGDLEGGAESRVMWRIYKEGQGKWARGLLVLVVMLAAVFALHQLHGYLPVKRDWAILGVDWRFVIHGPILVLASLLALWLFNRPHTADFLIDAENELRNKVTWPSRKEEINASVVVVATVVILGVFIFGMDMMFKALRSLLYSGG
jgi:preprotein translocase SecE subunit